MAEKREVFEQVEDEHGRTRLDRRLTPEEAAAQDACNAERLGPARAASFYQPFATGTEHEARAKRGTRKV
jgi:hypothetical protein